MSCKKSIFLAIDGVSRELIETANCGIYVEPENIDEIVSGVHKALKLRDELDKMGQNGYDYAKIHFDRKELAGKYIKEIEQYLHKG